MNGVDKQKLPNSLAVMDRGGNFVQRVSRDRAVEMLRRGNAALRDGRVVQLLAPDLGEYADGHARRARYSHDRETDTNPQGVWTLVPILHHGEALYTRVRDECLSLRAA